jgi:hypothetical protein
MVQTLTIIQLLYITTHETAFKILNALQRPYHTYDGTCGHQYWFFIDRSYFIWQADQFGKSTPGHRKTTYA